MRFDLLVFDWDGTLSDVAAMAILAAQKACVEMGYLAPSREKCSQVVGLGAVETIIHWVSDLKEEDIVPLSHLYRRFYLAKADKIMLYDGVLEGLKLLRDAGFWMAIATGKSRRALDAALDALQIKPFFDQGFCASLAL